MLIECQIHFAVERDQRLASVCVTAYLDAKDGLFMQASKEAFEWVSRQSRVHGVEYKCAGIEAVIYAAHDKWFCATGAAGGSGIDWDDAIVEAAGQQEYRPINERIDAYMQKVAALNDLATSKRPRG